MNIYEKNGADVVIEIERLKKELAATDYKAIKYAEGLISVEEYKEIKKTREGYRERIRELENND